MLIREAVPGDMAAVAEIFGHYVHDGVATFEETPPTAGEWERKLEGGLPFLVAEVEGEVAGFAYLSPWRPKPAYRHTAEDTIYVSPGRAGRGIGRALLGELLAHAEKAGTRRVIAVIADTGGDASVALHRAHGFVEAGRLTAVGYKHGRWVDTVLMQWG